LRSFSDQPRVYQSIGRLFVLEDYHGLMEKLQKEMETLDEQIITKQHLKSQFEAKWESTRGAQ
jgi:chaperonin cofactor prefoldin